MPDRDTRTDKTALSFGAFHLFPSRQMLLDGNKPVRIGSRALDILTALAERAGDVVTKDELMARVWPSAAIEEGALRVHIAALRKVLGGDGHQYVANVPGRGYRLVAPVFPSNGADLLAQLEQGNDAAGLLPSTTQIFGRDQTISSIAMQLQRSRFVTIAGPGGIGKTTVAVAIANHSGAAYGDKVYFVNYATLSDSRLVPGAVASRLGLSMRTEYPIPELVAHLKDKRLLLVLDNCEHVIEAVAELAEAVCRDVAGAHLLTTSREPLRAEGERVHRLGPLETPLASTRLGAAEAMQFPAIQLFVERASASSDTFELQDEDAALVAGICRKLDGIPLAIELAAGRVDAFGVPGLAAALEDSFAMFMRGRRTALPRQQTLKATLDWSYELLSGAEQLVLRRLAVFAGNFDIESAGAVAAGDGNSIANLYVHIANLVAKSLLTAEVGAEPAKYRLLETTRLYAQEKLGDADEVELIARRHAEYYRDVFARAQVESRKSSTREWLTQYAPDLDNLRAALDWAFSPRGDTALGIRLTVAAIPFWTHMSSMDECRRNVERALCSIGTDGSRDERESLQLHAALGTTLLSTVKTDAAIAPWSSALDIARRLGDTEYELRALWGLLTAHFSGRKFHAALDAARQFNDVAANSTDPVDRLAGDRMLGGALYILGDYRGARRHTERLLDRDAPRSDHSQISRFLLDQKVQARGTLSTLLWSQGCIDRAAGLVRLGTDEALATGHALSICNFLVHATPAALFMGNVSECDRLLAMLRENASQIRIDAWDVWARCLQAVLVIKRGEIYEGLRSLEAGLVDLRLMPHHPRNTLLHWEAALALGMTGQVEKGLAEIDQTLAECERSEELWCMAELHRIRGEVLRRSDRHDAAATAELCFRTGIDWALRQAVPSWELRSVMSLSRLLRDQGQRDEALSALAATYSKFTDGFGTCDLIEAKRLLEELA